MSSTEQATSPTESENVKLITNALADYADLCANPFAAKLEQSMSAGDILQLLEERQKTNIARATGD
ncbi:hypothetical protein V8E52_005035 [Russula decolorans]|jgi:hypothetical protein